LLRSKTMADELRLRRRTLSSLLGKPLSEDEVVPLTHRHARILLVEDNRAQAERLHTMLAEQYHVDRAFSIREAHEMVAEHSYDLVLTNYYMQDGDGLRLAFHVRGLQRTRRIPIIMMIGLQNTQAMLK